MEFERQAIRSRARGFMKQTRTYSTDGMPVDLSVYDCVSRLLEELSANGYLIEYAECFVREDLPRIGYFLVGQVVATKGDADLIYEFTPEYSIGGACSSLAEALSRLSVRQAALHFNGEPMAMGRGQYKEAERIAGRLLSEHTLVEDSTSVYVPCLTRKGRGGWGQTIAAREFTRASLAEKRK